MWEECFFGFVIIEDAYGDAPPRPVTLSGKFSKEESAFEFNGIFEGIK